MKKILIIFLSFMFLKVAANADTAKLISVIDGDTIKIEYDGKIQSLRLIGINAPEGRKTPAADRVKQLLKDKVIIIVEFDIEKYDKYGRLLGYVWLDNINMLNEKLVAEGYAAPKAYKPNIKYQKRLSAARPSPNTAKRKEKDANKTNKTKIDAKQSLKSSAQGPAGSLKKQKGK